MRGSRDSNDLYNPLSRGGNNNPNNMYNDQSSYDDNDGLPQYAIKILGPLAPKLLGPSEDNEYNDLTELQNRLRLYSLSLLGTSTFFWLWALYNTYHLRKSSADGEGFDLGIISFAGSAFSSILLLRSSLGGGRCYDRTQKCGCFGKKNKKDNENDSNNDDTEEEGVLYGINRRSKNRKRNDIDDEDASSSPKDHSPPGKWLRIFAVTTHLVVVANYMLGLLFSLTAGRRVYVYFGTYCFIFALLWLIVAYSGWILVSVYRGALARAFGKEYLEPRRRTSLLRSCLLYLTSLSSNHQQLPPTGGYSNVRDNEYYEQEYEDEIDDELMALTEGRGYTG